jgi:hypothetical protein
MRVSGIITNYFDNNVNKKKKNNGNFVVNIQPLDTNKILLYIGTPLLLLLSFGFINGGRIRGLYQREVDKIRGTSGSIGNFDKVANVFGGRIQTTFGYDPSLKANWIKVAIAQVNDQFKVVAFNKSSEALDPKLIDSDKAHVLDLHESFQSSKIASNLRLLKAGGEFYIDAQGKVHLGLMDRTVTGIADIGDHVLFGTSRVLRDLKNNVRSYWDRWIEPEKYANPTIRGRSRGGMNTTAELASAVI